MACCAIKKDGSLCRNYACELGPLCGAQELPVCWSHRSYTKALHAIRWWHRYFRSGRIFTYRWSKHLGKQMLRDLENGWVTLKPASVGRIPSTNLYMDIYTLLCSHGHIQPSWNTGLYKQTMAYVLQKFFMMEEVPTPSHLAEKKYLEPYLQTFLVTGPDLLFFLQQLPQIAQFPLIRDCMEHRPYVVPQWLQTFSESDAAKELCWQASEICPQVAELYAAMPADNSLRNHMLQRFLPDLRELYVAEKQTQKWKMDHIKEELMAVAWHPDRVSKLIEAGLEPDEM